MMEGVGRRLDSGDGVLVDIGSHSLNGRERNVLFRNNADGTFTDVGWVNGADRVEDGRALALLDSDGDGAMDIVLRNYGAPAGMLHNRPGRGHWVSFGLEGTTSNRDAVGARIRLRSGGRWQMRVVNSGSGYLSGSSRRLHFGLGDASTIDELVIEWPSGRKTVLGALEIDRLYFIREGEVTARTSSR